MQGSPLRRISALMRKEVLQLRQDHRTLGLMLMVPVLWLVLFGYAATFDVKDFHATLVNHAENAVEEERADALIGELEERGFDFRLTRDSREDAERDLRDGRSSVALVIDSEIEVLIDGSNVVTAQGAARGVQRAVQDLREEATAGQQPQQPQQPPSGEPPGSQATAPIVPEIEILYNPDLRSADFMIPGLIGMIILFVGGLMTSLGVVRERERGTLEQLTATPLRPLELVLGKVAPYALLAFVDLLLVVLMGIYVFDVDFVGDFLAFVVISIFFLLTALGIGLLISSISQNQQQAMQTAVFVLFPQFLLAGIIFPIEAIPWGIRWISYLLPLTYYVPVARGLFLKGTDPLALWPYITVLIGYSMIVLVLASLRFRRRGV